MKLSALLLIFPLLIVLAGCGDLVSPSELIRDSTATASFNAVSPSKDFKVVGGEYNIPPGSTKLRYNIRNKRGIPLIFSRETSGTTAGTVSVEPNGTAEAVIYIDGAEEGDIFNITLMMAKEDGGWDFDQPPCQLPPIVCVSPIPGGTLKIAGKNWVGATLTADDSLVTNNFGEPTSYQWKWDGTPTPIGTGPSYTIQAGDKDKNIKLTMTYLGDASNSITSEGHNIPAGAYTGIFSGEDLKTKLSSGLTEDFILANDITVSGTWAPIRGFKGHFDGNGQTIIMDNCSIIPNNESFGSQVGLFCMMQVGDVLDNPTIKNFHIKGSITVNGNAAADVAAYAGAVAGVNNGTIENVSSSVAITFNFTSPGAMRAVGGIAGVNQGTIKNCYSTGSIIVYNTGVANHDWWGVGGIAGATGNNVARACSIQNCWASGAISAQEASRQGSGADEFPLRPRTGGICGNLDVTDSNSKVIKNCVALNGSVSVRSGGSLGRVCANGDAIPNRLTNNWAWQDMPLTLGGVVQPVTSNATGIDGANVTLGNAAIEDWWAGTGPTKANWTINTTGGSESSPWKWDSANNRPILWFETAVNK